MSKTSGGDWRVRGSWMLASITALGLALAVGRVVPQRPLIGLLVAGVVLLVGITASRPFVVPLLAVPLMLVVPRVGAGGIDLTVSDVALGLAFWPAVLLAPRPFSRELRHLLWLNGAYQAAALFTVVANPFLANTVEWFHAWLLISGALIVGWTVGRTGYVRAGLGLLLLGSLVIAVSTIAQGLMQVVQGDFSPVYPTWPWFMHKNFVGCQLGVAAAITYVRPTWMGWPKRWAMVAFWLFCLGIAFAQSRQALLALGVVVAVVALRKHPDIRRSRLILLAVPPTLWVVATMVRDDLASTNVHNSVFQRLSWFEDTMQIWSDSPWLGHGLRYWYTDRVAEPFQPPNALLEVAATAGLVGLFGFLLFAIGTLRVLWRMEPIYGTLAFAVTLTRMIQSQFDLFWVSVSASLPFLVVGMCLGAAAISSAHSVTQLSSKTATVPLRTPMRDPRSFPPLTDRAD